MINFAVINLKTLIKNVLKLGFIIAFVIGVMNIFEIISFNFKNFNYFEVLKKSLSFEEKKEASKDFFKTAIVKEIAITEIKAEKPKEKRLVPNEIEENKQEESQEVKENIESKETISTSSNEEIPLSLPTKVIETNNLAENYNTTYKTVKIKNETKFNLTEDILTPNIEIKDKKNVIIFHTHTCESYTPTSENNYIPSGNYRTTDLNYSVARVGTVLEESLTNKGFNVIHDMNYHDYPAYNGSYDRSFNTVKNLLSKAPSTQLVIDLHRDAIGSMSNYAPSVKIGDEVVSQVMFVIGTNGGGLEHPNWQNNLKFAIKVQEKANEMYPRFI